LFSSSCWAGLSGLAPLSPKPERMIRVFSPGLSCSGKALFSFLTSVRMGSLRDFSAVFGKSAAGEQQGNRQNQAKQLGFHNPLFPFFPISQILIHPLINQYITFGIGILIALFYTTEKGGAKPFPQISSVCRQAFSHFSMVRRRRRWKLSCVSGGGSGTLVLLNQ